MRRRVVAAAIAFAATVVVAPEAAAAQAGGPQLRVYSPYGVVTLNCAAGEPTGTHPDPKQACAEIAAAGGDIAAIRPTHPGCTTEWDPVLIGVTGDWAGEDLLFSDIESNPGCAAISHGSVFYYGLPAR